MSYCPNCGREILEGQKFCGSCGTKIEETNKEPKNETNINENISNDSKNNKNNSWIWIIVIIIIIILYISGQSKNNDSNSLVSNDVAVTNTQENEISAIKEDAFPPEATKLYTFQNLEYKLPEEYYLGTADSTNILKSYYSYKKDGEQYGFTVTSLETGENINMEEFINGQNYKVDGVKTSKEYEIKTDIINGIKWYIKTIEIYDDNGTKAYDEFYFTNYGTYVYRVCFGYFCDEGVNFDISNSRNHYYIKQSLKFN